MLIVAIDEHEAHHLGMLLEQVFPDAYRQMATLVINQKGVAQGRLSRAEEYAIFVFMPEAFLKPHHDDLLSPDRADNKRFTTPRWEMLGFVPQPSLQNLANCTGHKLGMHPSEVTVRRVRHNGEIRWKGQLIYVSEVLAREPVGIRPIDDGLWELRYRFHPLGGFDERTQKISPPSQWHG